MSPGARIDARDFDGKVAIVTGAARGLGEAIAVELSALGAGLVLVDSDRAAGAATEARLKAAGGRVVLVAGDVSQAATAAAATAAAMDVHGGLDILINNAGIQRYGDVVSTSEETWDAVLGTNLKSMFLMAKHAVPRILERGGGAIVNMASVQAFAAQRGVVAYAASKGGVISLTRAMAIDLAPRVRVNAVCPGSVDTPMLRSAAELFSDDPSAAIESWGAMHPMGRVARPEEVAHAVTFLAGPRSSFTTGTYLVLDGGLLSGIPGT
ncbi:MAG: SDR family NAD(P)-dependent oxidoreductase [Candidatus Dormibacteria bacterium]